MKRIHDRQIVSAFDRLNKDQKEDVMGYINHIIRVAEISNPRKKGMVEIQKALKTGYIF